MKVLHLICGARPNFMKVAPLFHALRKETHWTRPVIVHTGQHYDYSMSAAFFADFGLPDPDYNLEVGSGSHAEQTGGVMIAYERLCCNDRPDWVIVVGDVNSTLACSLVAKKLQLPLAHLEARRNQPVSYRRYCGSPMDPFRGCGRKSLERRDPEGAY